MESLRLKYERLMTELQEENDFLEYENKKLKKKLGMALDSEDIIDLDEDEENQPSNCA